MIMATIGESSSAKPKLEDDKPVIVRVKRKVSQSPLDAFWLEINERPLKRPLLDFEKLSITDSAHKVELKAKKVLVRHVETVTSSDATVDIVQSFMVPSSSDATDDKPKNEDRRRIFKKDNRQDQLLSKAREHHEVLAKNARFEQIWRSRKGNKEAMHDKALYEMCHFYDVVRIDSEHKSMDLQAQADTSLEDQRILSSYLPLLREFIPSAAEEIEADIFAHIFKQEFIEEFVYDYYTVKDEINTDDNEDPVYSFPLVQVEDEDFYDGPDDTEYDSEDSNAEDNPRNDYPDETSEEEDEEEEEGEEEEEEEEEGGKEEEEEAGKEEEEDEEEYILYEDELYDHYSDKDWDVLDDVGDEDW